MARLTFVFAKPSETKVIRVQSKKMGMISLVILLLLSFSSEIALQQESSLPVGKFGAFTHTIDLKNERVFLYQNVEGKLFQMSFDGEISSRDIGIKDPVGLQNLYYSEDQNILMFWDDGGGRVHLLDLEDNSLKRVDNSFPFRSFHGHGAWVDESLNIHLMGGYGIFQLKNRFLEYSQELGEWMDIETRGDIPDPSYGRLYFNQLDSSYLYFEFEPENTPNLKTGATVYSLNTNTREWEKIGYFDTEDLGAHTGIVFINRIGTKRIDQENGILHLEDNLFYDISNERLISVELSLTIPEMLHIQSAYHTGEGDEWVVVGRKRGQNVELLTHKIRLSELMENAVVIQKESWMRSPSIYVALSLFLLLATGNGVYRSRKKWSAQKESNSQTRLTVSIQESDIIIEFGEKRFRVSDPFEQRLWAFVSSKVSKGLNSFDIQEFDDFVLGSLTHTSQRSKKRNALFASVKQLTGEELFVIQQSVMDKRYREIVVKNERIQWG